MATVDIHQINIKYKGVEYPIEFSVPSLPNPVNCPDGFIVGQEHNGRLARGRHDPVPRKPGHQTNEIEVLRPILDNGSGVDLRSKITFRITNKTTGTFIRALFLSGFKKQAFALARSIYPWVDEFYRLNGPWVTERLFSEGVGWFDTGFPAFSLLSTGGNLHEILVDGDNFAGWVAVNYQKFQDDPKQLDYFKSPQDVIKQTLVTGQTETRIIIDKGPLGGYGDTYLPKVAPEQPYHSTWDRDNHNGLEFIPPLPFETKLYREAIEPDKAQKGVPVTVEKYCFWGSNTYGLVNGLWYTLEEMLVIGDYEADPSRGGTQDDRRVYVDDWLVTCPPPVIGWTRQS